MIIALVAEGTQNSSAANLRTSVIGAFSGTLTLGAVRRAEKTLISVNKRSFFQSLKDTHTL